MPDKLPETKVSEKIESLVKMIGGVMALFYTFGYLANGLYLSNYGIPSAKAQNVLTGFLFILFLIAPVGVLVFPIKLAMLTEPPDILVEGTWWIADRLNLKRWWLKSPESRNKYLSGRLPRIPIWLMYFVFSFVVFTCLLDIVLDYDSFVHNTDKWPLWKLYFLPWFVYKPTGSLLIPEGNQAAILIWFWFFGLICFFGGTSGLLFLKKEARWPWILIIGGAALSVHYYTDKVHPRWEASLGGGFYGFCDIEIKQSLKPDSKHDAPDDKLLEFFSEKKSERTLRNQFVVLEDDSAIYVRPADADDFDVIIRFPNVWDSKKKISEKKTNGAERQPERTPETYVVRIPKESVGAVCSVINDGCKRPWSED